jgi:GR25 family glycosyltransferase involved in LPS biosynthesis
MEREMKLVGITAHRHAGKTPSQYPVLPQHATMQNRTPGAIGCYRGQMIIMESAAEFGKSAIVFEDDLIFCSDFTDRLDYISAWTQTHEWDVIWLGASFHSPAFWHRHGRSGMNPDCSRQLGKDCETTDDPRMIRTFAAFSTHAYIVNHDSIPVVLAELDRQMPTSIGIDYSFIRMQPDIKAFSFVPGCVKQYDNESNIGTGITRWSGFLKLNGTEENSRYVWQDRMSDFNPETFEWK